MNFSTHHINYLERGFPNEQQVIELNRSAWLEIRQGSLQLLQITSLPRFTTFTEHGRSPEIRRIGDLLTGIHGLEYSLVYAIAGSATEVNLFMGTCQHTGVVQPGSVLPALLNSTCTGIETQLYTQECRIKWQEQLLQLPHTALITGTPTLKAKTSQMADQPIDRLIRALHGTQWAYIIVAKPLLLVELQVLSDATLNERRLIANAEQRAGTANPMIGNPIAEAYKQALNRFWQKLELGKSQGMWHTVGYFLAGDRQTLERAKAVGQAIFGGTASVPDPVRMLNVNGVSRQATTFSMPAVPPPPAPGHIQYPYQYLSLLNSTELSALVHLPTQETSGFFVRPQARFDVTSHVTSSTGREIELGEIIDQGRHTGTHYRIGLDSLTRHATVAGTTGSGKTNTVFWILRQLASLSVPFLVIEPAKTEYRALLDSELRHSLRVFTLGNETLSPFRLNPFQLLPGVSVQTHIDHLKSVFNASFAMYAPMPYVLERCIHEIYEDKGWDLVTSENRRGIHSHAYPTLSDLYRKIDPVVARLGYDTKATMDIKAALKTRVNSLRIGGKGLMLDTHTSVPISTLLEAPTILELDSIGDDDEKAFLIGLILMLLYEHYRSTGHSEGGGLRHVTVVEEAHRLLKRTPPIANLEVANMAGKAVESFTNILAEIRAYGEGIIVAEQIPSKLAPEILKNTNLKIVHRTVAEEDRQLIGSTMCLEADQARWLGVCPTGEAVIFGDQDDGSLRIWVPYEKIRSVTGYQSHAMVHQAMTGFKEQQVECFNPYAWSSLATSIIRKHHSQTSYIVEHQEFQTLFARYVISAVVAEMTLFTEFPTLAQWVRKYTNPTDEAGLLKTVLVYGINELFDRQGRQTGAAYNDIQALKALASQLLLGSVLPAQRRSEHEFSAILAEADLNHRVARFQSEFKRIFQGIVAPFAGCQHVCANQTCLYRHQASGLVHDTRLYRSFAEALASPSNLSEPEPWQRLAEVSQQAARRIVADLVPQAERQKAALCFAIQMSEAMPTLDASLREKLLTGLLKLNNGGTKS